MLVSGVQRRSTVPALATGDTINAEPGLFRDVHTLTRSGVRIVLAGDAVSADFLRHLPIGPV